MFNFPFVLLAMVHARQTETNMSLAESMASNMKCVVSGLKELIMDESHFFIVFTCLPISFS